MIDNNFLLYLRKLGFSQIQGREKDEIDFICTMGCGMIFKKPLRMHPYTCPPFVENGSFFLKLIFSFPRVVQNGNNRIIFYFNNKRCFFENNCHVKLLQCPLLSFLIYLHQKK